MLYHNYTLATHKKMQMKLLFVSKLSLELFFNIAVNDSDACSLYDHQSASFVAQNITASENGSIWAH